MASKKLKLWKIEPISTEGRRNWEVYNAAIVAAYTETEAVQIHPGGNELQTEWSKLQWPAPEQVKATLVGIAADNIKPGEIVLSDFWEA